jgi:hypothetical protein
MTAVVAPPGFTKKDPINPQSISDCWISPTDYPNFLSYAADPIKSQFLNKYIIQACTKINTMCNRYFNSQQVDEIFDKTVLNMRDYSTFIIGNYPLVSVDYMWVNVVNTFNIVSLDYLQIDTRTGLVKILPNFSIYVQTTLPQWALKPSSTFWIRYTIGFDNVGGVPEDIKRATALMVDYLFGLDSLTPNISSFRTQTYSETTAKASEDPIMSRIEALIAPYRINKIAY